MIRILVPLLVLMASSTSFAQDEIYSGPQPEEKLEPFLMTYGFGEMTGKEIDLVSSADNGPVVIMFVHKRSRPAFGLANAMMRYCVKQKKEDLTSAICFLADDRTETEEWLGRVSRYFPKGATVGISADGAEGPGTYGLNRNVQLTVIVGNQNKVVNNFALIQPAMHADGPAILKSIARVLVGTTDGTIKTIEQNDWPALVEERPGNTNPR